MINEKQRERLLHILSDAPAEILIGAVEDYKAFKVHQSESLNTVFKYFGEGKAKEILSPSVVTAAIEEAGRPEKLKENNFIKPPGVAAGKIGSETEAVVIAHLRSGPDSLQNLAVAMKRNEKIAETLLARLWDKKKILFRSDRLYCLP